MLTNICSVRHSFEYKKFINENTRVCCVLGLGGLQTRRATTNIMNNQS